MLWLCCASHLPMRSSPSTTRAGMHWHQPPLTLALGRGVCAVQPQAVVGCLLDGGEWDEQRGVALRCCCRGLLLLLLLGGLAAKAKEGGGRHGPAGRTGMLDDT